MTTTRSAAALAAACVAVLAGCASHGTAPGAGADRSPGTSTTAAPSAPASTPATTAPASTPVTTAPGTTAPGTTPAGPFPAGTGTVASPFNGMCMTLAADGIAVAAWKCSPGASTQQWTGYSDGTLRTNGKCLDVTGPQAGASAKVAACTGAASQKWRISQVSSNNFGSIINTGTGTALTDPGSSTTNGTQLVMGPDRGDQTYPWHVSFHHYMAA